MRNETFTLPDGTSFDMIFVDSGDFMMGMEKDDPDAYHDEQPVHPVAVAGFFIGKYPVTQALWRAVARAAPEFKLEESPSRFSGGLRPVEQVSWDDINQRFLPALQKLTGRDFRLPSEAEWEYAARGGKYHAENYKYAGSDKLKEVGWYAENSHDKTQDVGLKYPNQLGLYDLSGNVWEWCADDWHSHYNDAPKDGKPWIDSPERGAWRVPRGGSYLFDPRDCRVAYRSYYSPGYRGDILGFRLALSLQSVG